MRYSKYERNPKQAFGQTNRLVLKLQLVASDKLAWILTESMLHGLIKSLTPKFQSMEKAYEPKAYEPKIYQRWTQAGIGLFATANRLNLTSQAATKNNFAKSQSDNTNQTSEIQSFSQIQDLDSSSRPHPLTTFIMPPPNLTGSLHLGHVLEHSLYDTYQRYATVHGQTSVFLPGVDHAGIQFEGTIEKQLKSEGESKEQIGYERFIQKSWEFATESKDNIKHIAASVGELPAWDKMHFTMDNASTVAVRGAFLDYWRRGWVYKGTQLVNWSVGLQTAVSEVFGDIDWEDRIDPLITFEYEVKQSVFGNRMSHQVGQQWLPGPHPALINLAQNYLKPCHLWPRLPLATVRPETKFTDVAVAIHPSKFGKYFNLDIFEITKTGFDADLAQLFVDLIVQNQIEIYLHLPPLNSGAIKLIISDKVIADFGTGILKITPGHDPFDYQLYLEFVEAGLLQGDVPIQQSVGRDGRLTSLAGEFAGLTVSESRPKIIAKLIQTGYIPLRPEPYQGKVKLTDLPAELVKKAGELVEQARLATPEAILNYQIEWDYSHNVQICERSKTVIEPLISTEWFVNMTSEKGIRDKALQKLNTTNDIVFFPERFKEKAQDFLLKLKDWVISRNLWWGHRFPVWYCEDCNSNHEFFLPDQFVPNIDSDSSGSVIDQVSPLLPPKGFIVWPHLNRPSHCPCCHSHNLIQEERVLDTWFSSSLWPLIMTGFDFTAYLRQQHVFETYPYLSLEEKSNLDAISYSNLNSEVQLNHNAFIPIVFDFDGTLVDSWDATVNAHMEHTGQTHQQVTDYLLNDRLVKPRYTKDRVYTVVETDELMRFREEEYARKLKYRMTVFQGFLNELKLLQSNQSVKLAIVSTAYQPVIDQFVAESELQFTHVFGFGPNFSKQAKMEEVSLDWGVKMHDLYFVTDTIRDIIEAQEYLDPTKILGCSWGFHGYDRLRQVLPESQIMREYDQVSDLATQSAKPIEIGDSSMNQPQEIVSNSLNRPKDPTTDFEDKVLLDSDPRARFLKSLNGESRVADENLFINGYPTAMLTCASEIFNIWVCRMIMLGYHFTDQPPFKHLFIHAVVRDEKGRKFSKSLGNGIDPQDLLDKYSADSIRAALNSQIVPGRDILMSSRSADELVLKWRNFGNKLWNVARFIQEKHESFRKPIKNIVLDWSGVVFGGQGMEPGNPAKARIIDSTRQFMLQQLQASYHLYYLTNSSQATFEVRSQTEIFELFKDGYASYQSQYSKPEREFFQEFVAKYDLDPTESVLIDDTSDHIQTATLLGFRTILFREGQVDLEQEFARIVRSSSLANTSSSYTQDSKNLAAASVWIAGKLNTLRDNIATGMQQYRLGQVMDDIYNFVWDDLADWYIEYLKTDPSQLDFAYNEIVMPLVKLLYPFLPFETEAIWGVLQPQSTLLALGSNDSQFVSVVDGNGAEFTQIQSFVTQFRKLRGLYRIDPVVKTTIYSDNTTLHKYNTFLNLVARVTVSPVSTTDTANFYNENWSEITFAFDLLQLISEPQLELDRSQKDLEKTLVEIHKLESLLANPGFVAKAQPESILKSRDDLESNLHKHAQNSTKIQWLKAHIEI